MKSIINDLDIFDTWQRLSRFPGGKWLFSRLVGWAAPYSGTVSPRVAELQPGKSTVSIRDRHKLRNHLGSIHAIALINLGEFSSGLALYAMMPRTHRGIIRGISMRYLKKARGKIQAVCQVAPLQWVEGDMDTVLTSQLYDESGELVAVAEVNWRLGLKSRSGEAARA